jgi:hypothetical protein
VEEGGRGVRRREGRGGEGGSGWKRRVRMKRWCWRRRRGEEEEEEKKKKKKKGVRGETRLCCCFTRILRRRLCFIEVQGWRRKRQGAGWKRGGLGRGGCREIQR